MVKPASRQKKHHKTFTHSNHKKAEVNFKSLKSAFKLIFFFKKNKISKKTVTSQSSSLPTPLKVLYNSAIQHQELTRIYDVH